MKQEASKMIAGLTATAVIIAVITGSPLALLIAALTGYSVWQVAKGFDE